MWNSPPNPATVEQEPFFHSSTLPAISMDFQKIKKNKAIDTISQIVQPWPARGEEQPDTAPRPGNVFPPHRQPFLQSTIFINSCQSGHSISQIINCITYDPSIPVFETGALCNQTPRGTWPDEVKKCQEQLNLQTKKNNRKSMKKKQTKFKK